MYQRTKLKRAYVELRKQNKERFSVLPDRVVQAREKMEGLQRRARSYE